MGELEVLMIIVIIAITIIMGGEFPVSPYLILALILLFVIFVVICAVACILSPDRVDVHLLRKLVREYENDKHLLDCKECPYKKRLKLPWIYRCTVFGHNITRKTDTTCLLCHCEKKNIQKEIDEAIRFEERRKMPITRSEIKAIIAEIIDKKAEDIGNKDDLEKDLGMDILDCYDIMLALEERTGIEIDACPFEFRTVDECIQFLKSEGKEIIDR